MKDNLKSYMILAGVVGISYAAYKYYTETVISQKLTVKIAQQIKHQMLIVTINFAEGIKKHMKEAPKEKTEQEKVKEYFVQKLSEIYKQKQKIVLSKYAVPEDVYRNSLKRYSKNKRLKAIQQETIEMMESAVKGEIPDLTVPDKARNRFGKEEIKLIYLEMCKMIAYKVTERLQLEKRNNPYFNSSDDDSFRKVIRQLSLFDMKVAFLNTKGFKQQWGCSNEIFFKISEGYKLNDPEFKAKMNKIEKAYENIIDEVSKDPDSVQLQDISSYFVEKDSQFKRLTKSYAQEAFDDDEPLLMVNKSARSEPEALIEHEKYSEPKNSEDQKDQFKVEAQIEKIEVQVAKITEAEIQKQNATVEQTVTNKEDEIAKDQQKLQESSPPEPATVEDGQHMEEAIKVEPEPEPQLETNDVVSKQTEQQKNEENEESKENKQGQKIVQQSHEQEPIKSAEEQAANEPLAQQ